MPCRHDVSMLVRCPECDRQGGLRAASPVVGSTEPNFHYPETWESIGYLRGASVYECPRCYALVRNPKAHHDIPHAEDLW